MEKNYQKVGSINVNEDDYVVVADPCYNLDCRWIDIVEVKRGKYNCYVEIDDYGLWGKRVKRMAILNEEYNKEIFDKIGDIRCEVAVDSGTMGIYGYGYFEKTHNGEDVDSNWYKQYVIKEWSNNYRFCKDQAFMCMSGFGDGAYEVYEYTNKNGNVIGLEIEFITDEEENE